MESPPLTRHGSEQLHGLQNTATQSFGSTRTSTRTNVRLPRVFKYLAVPYSPVKLLKVKDIQEV